MDNQDRPIDKTTETLRKELETLSSTELHDLFIFFYKLNHYQANLLPNYKFDEFLETFEKNPFKHQEDKAFRKQLIDNLIKFTVDRMSLLTAAMLLKRKFTLDEVVGNYYANVDLFAPDLYKQLLPGTDSTKWRC